jgi:2-iminoacetate synthase
MIFRPEKYRIKDQRMKPFIDSDEILELIRTIPATKERVREIIAKSLDKNRLTLEETVILINADDPDLVEEIKMFYSLLYISGTCVLTTVPIAVTKLPTSR